MPEHRNPTLDRNHEDSTPAEFLTCPNYGHELGALAVAVATPETSSGQTRRALIELLRDHPSPRVEDFERVAREVGVPTDVLSAELGELFLRGQVRYRGAEYQVVVR